MRTRQSAAAPQDTSPIDLDHLSRQTQGDAGLEREVLQLFLGQAMSVRSELAGADDEGRARLAHSLVGASRAVGAFILADAAAELETAPQSIEIMELFSSRIDEVSAFVSELLG